MLPFSIKDTTILLLLFLLLHPPATLSYSCNQTSVMAGDTWVEISWSLHCDVDTLEMVSRYHLSLIDNTAGIYNQDTSQYCMERQCSFLFDLARPCIDYTINLELIDLEENIYIYEDNQVTTDEEDPSAPRLLTSNGSDTDTLDLSWYPPSAGEYCVVKYEVCYTSSERSAKTNCDDAVNTNTTLENLLPCTQYMVTVTPVTDKSTKGLSSYVTASTGDADPEKPDSVVVEDRGYDYISLEWVKPELNKQCIKGGGAVCVETSFLPATPSPASSTQPTSPSTPKTLRIKSADTSLSNVYNLASCTAYTCWVVYPDTAGGWIQSDTVSQSTWVKGVTISQPSSVSSHPVGTTSMQVSWGAPSQAARCVDNYIVAWMDDMEGKEEILSADTYSYTITSLRACMEYQLDIKAFSTNWGQDKFGASATFSQRTDVTTPGPVLDLQLVNKTQDSFTMGWNPPAIEPQCVQHYDYKVSGGPLVDDCFQVYGEDVQLQAHVGNLVCGSSYTFSVWAVNELDQSSLTKMMDIETESCG